MLMLTAFVLLTHRTFNTEVSLLQNLAQYVNVDSLRTPYSPYTVHSTQKSVCFRTLRSMLMFTAFVLLTHCTLNTEVSLLQNLVQYVNVDSLRTPLILTVHSTEKSVCFRTLRSMLMLTAFVLLTHRTLNTEVSLLQNLAQYANVYSLRTPYSLYTQHRSQSASEPCAVC